MTNKLKLLAEFRIRFLGRALSEEQRKAIDAFELSLERLAHKFAEDHLLFFEVGDARRIQGVGNDSSQINKHGQDYARVSGYAKHAVFVKRFFQLLGEE